MSEEEIAREMQKKSYHYVMHVPGRDNLYFKTIKVATEFMRESLSEVSGIKIETIDKFLEK